MSYKLTRRDFLKVAGFAVGSLAFKPLPDPQDEHSLPGVQLGRVTRDSSVFIHPSWPEGETVSYLHSDDLVNLYYELTPPSGPPYNPVWYRVWGGYLHSGYVQRVEFRFNEIVDKLPETGQLCEVTVPYTQNLPVQPFIRLGETQPALLLFYPLGSWDRQWA